jgi:hypothetical protein
MAWLCFSELSYGLAFFKKKKRISGYNWLAVACKRSEDVKRGPILSECRGCFTLQIDRFTMGGVNHRGVTSSKLNHTIRNLYQYQKKQKLTWGLEVDNWKAVPVQNRLKTTRNLVRKQSYHLFLGWVILEKKTGCRRRIVNKEDLVAEDKPRLVSSCVGPSCR